MPWSTRYLLSIILLGLATVSAAAPVTYMYVGTITLESGYSGVNVGDAITITVTYDPMTGPPEFTSYNNGSTEATIQDLTGADYGTPWSTWMSVTASFDSYSWQNDWTGGSGGSIGLINTGELQVVDNLVTGSDFYDDYLPFSVNQEYNSGGQIAQLYGFWYASALGSSPPSLTNGLDFPQPINLADATSQNGEFLTTVPGQGTEFVTFDLNQNGIDIPVSVPEPATLSLLGVGLAGLGFARRRELK